MDSTSKFEKKMKKINSIPPKEAFYSILKDEGITGEVYQHALNVWGTFNLKTMGDYHDLYRSDVLLLADVFENFRKTCKEHYKLDP